MINEILFLCILQIIVFICMTIWIVSQLKRPFTLSDVLFYPDVECIKSKKYSDISDVQCVSIIRWIPVVNLIVGGIILFCLFVIYCFQLNEWLYKNTIKKIFSKIVFK